MANVEITEFVGRIKADSNINDIIQIHLVGPQFETWSLERLKNEVMMGIDGEM